MVLIIDNYDSFTFNILQAVGKFRSDVTVVKNDEMSILDIQKLSPSHLIFSPGPGIPERAGITLNAIESFLGKVPMLGICLGYQAMGIIFGGKLCPAPKLVHGKTSQIQHDGRGLFKDVQNPCEVMRYHSWVIDESSSLSQDVVVSARTFDGIPMALRWTKGQAQGVQFHPESILTFEGEKMIRNFLNHA